MGMSAKKYSIGAKKLFWRNRAFSTDGNLAIIELQSTSMSNALLINTHSAQQPLLNYTEAEITHIQPLLNYTETEIAHIKLLKTQLFREHFPS